MSRKIDQEILERFYKGQCTREERLQVLEWMRSAENDKEITALLQQHWYHLGEHPPVHSTDFEALYDKISTNFEPTGKVRKLYDSKLLLRVASVFIGLLVLAGVAYQLWLNQAIHYATDYGETAQIVLPDSSVVTLNGNSALTYKTGWGLDAHRRSASRRGASREVWLEGEAFFSVVHTQSHQKFVVNTSEEFSIEVLGTQFNVSNRKSGTKVILNEGKIKLNIQTQDKPEKGTENVIMQPGELVSFQENPADYTKKRVNPEMYSSWKEHRLLLDNTSLHEIITFLEETYGLQVEVSDPKLLGQKGSGSMPTKDLSLLLDVIAETFGIEVRQHDQNIYISYQP